MEKTFICETCPRDEYDCVPKRKNKYFFSNEELGKSDSERLCLKCVFNSKQPICIKHCTTCTCKPEPFPGVDNPFCMNSPPHKLDTLFSKYPGLSLSDVRPGWVETEPFFQKLRHTNRLWCLNLKFLTEKGEQKKYVFTGCHACRNNGFSHNIDVSGRWMKILKVKLFLKGFGK